eukprot:GHVS01087321.1.p1 GENE.GHVS01087321.1~~GHVS01087321.1.p1  ORF type:complete len:110 (-),score=0.43 GHVS01087321.1:52-381(-)
MTSFSCLMFACRATTRGAVPVDTNLDFIPDYLDIASEMKGATAEHCARLFDAETAVLLENSNCQWMSDSQLIVNLSKDFKIQVSYTRSHTSQPDSMISTVDAGRGLLIH